MAGDWIKMRSNLSTHPKVVRISSALNADRLRVIGGLHAVWCLFDEHSDDGSLIGYTMDALDNLIGWPGFSAAMQKVEWLIESGETLVTPRFEDHNGQSAKRRAQEAERKRSARNAVEKPQSVRNTSAFNADKKRTREEKRREDKEHTPPETAKFDFLASLIEKGVSKSAAGDFMATRKTKKLTPTETAFNGLVAEIEKSGLSFSAAIELCCRKGWGGFECGWLKADEKPINGKSGYVLPEFMRGAI